MEPSIAAQVAARVREGCTDEKIYLALRQRSLDYHPTTNTPHWPLCIAAARALWTMPVTDVTQELVNVLNYVSILPEKALAEMFETDPDHAHVLGHTEIRAFLERSKDWPSRSSTHGVRERINARIALALAGQ